jgi:dimethylglycine dehydrogenase
VSPRCDWSKENFPWLRARSMSIGHAEVVAMSVSFSGELGWELHVPNEQLYLVWSILEQAGAEFDLGYFGLYATESMRLEKGFLHWKADLIVDHNPFEAGLDRFVKLDKPEFIGKAALIERHDKGLRKKLVSMNVDCDFAPAHGGGGVFAHGKQIGSITSSGYGHRISKNIAYAYIDPEFSAVGQALEIGILGERYPAIIVSPIQYDPDHSRVKS